MWWCFLVMCVLLAVAYLALRRQWRRAQGKGRLMNVLAFLQEMQLLIAQLRSGWRGIDWRVIGMICANLLVLAQLIAFLFWFSDMLLGKAEARQLGSYATLVIVALGVLVAFAYLGEGSLSRIRATLNRTSRQASNRGSGPDI